MANKRPTELTDDQVKKHAPIADATIEKDLAETQKEIDDLRQVRKGELLIADHHLSANERELARFRAESRPAMIEEREEFVAFLQLLKRRRAEVLNATAPA